MKIANIIGLSSRKKINTQKVASHSEVSRNFVDRIHHDLNRLEVYELPKSRKTISRLSKIMKELITKK